MNDLILENQMMPGSILRAMFQRIRKKRPTKEGRDEQNELNDETENGQERRQNRRRRHQNEAEMGKNEREKGETIELRPTNREMIASPLLMENDEEEEGNNAEEEAEIEEPNKEDDWVLNE